ncbi:MAG: ABC transporter ATP-binding protein [Deltaproteobacteria bacterium]|jgi:putative ABC transport system ATP-binding protein|nr:ABC transporter ATP-binding protein [Deltaproteobacteria bacterium]
MMVQSACNVEANGAAGQESAAYAVVLEDVIFRWPGQQAPTLAIPFFSARQGEQVFISGPSGSGTSTWLGLIAGILSPDSGAVRVNGVRLNELGGAKRDIFRGDNIGFIFQQFNLIPYLSILENVLIPCRFSPLRNERACAQAETPLAEAKKLLERLDLSASLWRKPVNKLSVGQQQRVAAARALIGKPPLLIADEPTSSLDADRRKAFLQLLLGECRSLGASLLFVSHDQSLAEEFSTRTHLPDLNRAAEEVV